MLIRSFLLLLVSNLAPLANAQEADEGPLVWGRTITVTKGSTLTEEQSTVIIAGEFPFLCEWFKGPTKAHWNGSEPIPNGIERIKAETISTSTYAEHRPMAFSSLEGFEVQTSVRFWVRVTDSIGMAIDSLLINVQKPTSEELEAGPPQFIEWVDLPEAFARETRLEGVVSQPGMKFANKGPWKISVFKGDTGDDSTLLAETSLSIAASSNEFVYRLRGFTLTETTRIWVRLQSTFGVIKFPSQTLVVESDLAEPAFEAWQSVSEGQFAGEVAMVEAKLNRPETATIFAWYWGESGDTSNPMQSVDGYEKLPGLTNLQFEMPNSQRSFWVRATGLDYSIDSPTAQCMPRPPTVPWIIEEPEDIFLRTTLTGMNLTLEATGGDIAVQWYQGSSGDTSTPVTAHPIPLEGNRVSYSFDPFSFSQVWCRVSNSVGTVDSRTVTILQPSANSLQFIEQPSRVEIHTLPFQEDAFIQCFRYRATMVPAYTTCQRWVDGSWVDHGGSPTYFRDGSGEDIGISVLLEPATYYALPSGTYRLKANNYGTYFYSEPFSLINHRLDGTESAVISRIKLLYSSGAETEGGLYKARVDLNFAYSTFQVYAGTIGNVDRPVSSYVNDNLLFHPPNLHFHRRYLEISWTPNGESRYWLEVTTPTGQTVQGVIKHGDAFALSEAILSGQEAYSIRIPEGTQSIPLPRLPDTANWYLDDDRSHPLSLPLTTSQLAGEMRMLDAVLTQTGSAGAPVRVEVALDRTEPPLLARQPTRAMVDWNSRILWSGTVDGLVERTHLFAGTTADDLTEVALLPDAVTRGLLIPEDADFVRFDWVGTGGVRQVELPVTRLPAILETAADIVWIADGVLYSEAFGPLFSAWYFPWIFHHELGWWYCYPSESGFYFFGITSSAGASWNWTSPAVYPYIYNYDTGYWRYYYKGSSRYFYDFRDRFWDILDQD